MANKKYNKRKNNNSNTETYKNGNPKFDQYGRALTFNGNYYSYFKTGETKNEFTYEARIAKTDRTETVTQRKVWVFGTYISKSTGKITFKGVENKKSVRYKGNEKGNRHICMIVTAFYHNTGVEVKEWVDINLENGTCVFEKMNMLADARTYPEGSITKIVKTLK